MAYCSTEYFQTIVSDQKSIHEREKRRHELEEELFAYTRSEERQAKLKCVKMQHYHRELCKREQQAKARNLELLRSVENLVSKAKEFSIDYNALLHLKLECTHHISRVLEESKRRRGENPLEAPKGNNLQDYSTSIPPSTGGSAQPANVVTGQQALHGRSEESGVLSVHSPSLTGPVPNHHSPSQPQSCPLTDTPVSKTSHDVPLSALQNSDDSTDGAGILHRMLLPSVRRPLAGHDHGPGQAGSPCGTSHASGASSHRGTVSLLLHHHLSQSPSPDTHLSKVSTRHGGSGEPANGTGIGTMAGVKLPRKHPDFPEQGQKGSPRTPSTPSFDVAVTPQRSPNTASDVSVSLSDSLRELSCSGGGAPTAGQNNAPSTGRKTPEDTMQCRGPPSPKPEHRLSLEGFFNLLDSIEEHLPAQDVELYGSPAVSEQKLRDIISLSSGLCREDLAAGAGMVLQQLPCLARSMPDGCLLPSHVVHTHWSTASDAAQIRSCLSGDGALLWERWLTHVRQLLRWDVMPLEHAVRLFTPLILSSGSSYTDKAEVLLKRLLTHVAEAGLLSESEESSSCSLPSLLRDGPEIRLARPSENPAAQEVQSGEEDSADQSPVESIPIRETKAYQLLKQSVTQEKHWRSRHEEKGASDLEPSDVSDIEKPKREGLVQDSRKDPNRNVQGFSAVQSKAFWGDSDDTNSDIEMALRPQLHNTYDDFDDFYD